MKILKDGFLGKLSELIPIAGLALLEVSCGNGSRSISFASHCKNLYAIHPDRFLIEIANKRNIVNVISLCEKHKI